MDILDLLSEKFGSYKLTNDNNEIRFLCPFCPNKGYGIDSDYHLYINIEKKVLHCFRCGASESLFSIFGRALQGYITIKQQRKRSYPTLEGMDVLEGATTYVAQLSQKYLKQRGITDLSSIYYGVSGREWFGRVIFTVIEDEKVVFATGRAILNGITPKYFNRGDKSQYVYLLDKCIYSPYIVICEGCIDALSCKNGVALMGKEMSKIQMYKLYLTVPTSRPIYVALDPDAKKEGIKIARLLSSHYEKVYFCNLPENKDMNDIHGDWMSYPMIQVTKNNLISIGRLL